MGLHYYNILLPITKPYFTKCLATNVTNYQIFYLEIPETSLVTSIVKKNWEKRK